MTKKHCVYLYDNTIEGMLNAVALAVKSNGGVRGVYCQSSYQRQIFAEHILLQTDSAQAKKLFNFLKMSNGRCALLALNGFLSEDSEAANHLRNLVIEKVNSGAAIAEDYTNESVRYLERLASKVGLETHRFTGLIRFQLLKKELLYGPFEPDNNIIGYLAQHFKKRLGRRRWILHDIRRQLTMYWDGSRFLDIEIDPVFTSHVAEMGNIPEVMLSSDENYYQKLWNSFHHSISNASRENKTLQKQRMPRRYWKYLVEMQEQSMTRK